MESGRRFLLALNSLYKEDKKQKQKQII